MMWVQRIGMDFVRYKRQAAVAYLLTEDLYDSGALEDWRLINGTIEALLGDSDSLNPEGMRQLAEAAGITSAGDLIDDEKHVARFSRDGKRIYYHELGLELEPEKEAGCSIAVMDADGGNRRRLTDGSKDYMFLSMSPWAEVQSFKARQQIERSRRERENEDRGRKD
jgi:hypothetical protein